MNKIFVWVFIIVHQLLSSGAASKSVSCESTTVALWPVAGSQKTCFMYGSTVINSNETNIASTRDETVTGLTFNANKKIMFAPIEVAKSFPNLVGYSLYSCSIKTISKRHFKDLGKLRALWLGANNIEKIATDTFQDLVSLEFLNLGGNKIKLMNGELFTRLNKLTSVELGNNECIDEVFNTKAKLATLSEVVTEKCGFVESENHSLVQNDQTCELKLAAKMTENTEKRIKIASLEAKLQAALVAESKAEAKADIILEISEKLDAHRNRTFEVKTEELRNLLALKLQEISELLDAKIKVEASSKEKDQTIENLKKKNEIINENCNF